MIPNHLKFGGGIAETTIHPALLLLTIFAVVLLFVLRRKYMVVPLLALTLLAPFGQQVVVGGLHLFVLRILILAGCARMITQKRVRWDLLDKLFAAWAVCRSVVFILLFHDTGALVNQAGFLLDAFGGFFLLRHLIQDQKDVRGSVKVLAGVAVFLAACMLNERISHINIFGYLGGVPVVPTMREGSVRAQGPFAHAILAGSFGATMFPLFFWLWISRGARVVAAAGMVSAVIITMTSASSTPVMALAAGMFAICLWPMRNRLSILRWGGLAMIAGLAAVMKAPVWFLIARIDLIGGSSGFHRALLIDQFIRHFSDWWLIGTNSNGDWGWDMWDTCNTFVTEGETGGLVTFICFVALVWMFFKRFGQARRAARGNRKKEWFYWLLGATLFSHTVAFFGIVYFDQTRMLWYAFLAMGIAATAPALAARMPKVRTEDSEPTAVSGPPLVLSPEVPF